MDGPAFKRRRVSPRSAASGASSALLTNNATQPSTEASAPGRQSHQQQQLLQQQPASASHTKSSLLRSGIPMPVNKSLSIPHRTALAVNRSLGESTTKAPTTHAAPASDLVTEEDSQPAPFDDTFLDSAQSARSAGGEYYSTTPKRSPVKPSPRPLPPPVPEGEDELAALLRRRTRRSPVTGISIPPPPEPDLPPSVLDVVASTPPRGIHSSPSRWKGGSRSKRDSARKLAMKKFGKDAGEGSDLGLGTRRSLFPSAAQERRVASPSLETGTDPARRVFTRDVDHERIKERATLLAELSTLEADLEIAQKENERIRVMQDTGRVLSSSDEEAVKRVVQRYLVDGEEPPLPQASHQLMKMALNPMALLPFGKMEPIIVVPVEEDISDIRSHHPIQMSAAEELPYLQLFTPFAVESSLSMLPQAPGEPVRQRRSITFRSKDNPGLFTSRVEMVINATNLGILELNVLALEPSAKAELEPFVTKLCSGQCNRSMQRNIGILSWAMAEWYRISLQRAKVWTLLNRDLSTKDGLLEQVREMRKRKSKRKRDEEDNPEAESSVSNNKACKTSELLYWMGQQTVDFELPPLSSSGATSSLRLEWKIGFDWVGEAESKITVFVGVPGKWRQADERGIFGKLPALFEKLTEEGEDPSVAVKTILSLLAGDRGE